MAAQQTNFLSVIIAQFINRVGKFVFGSSMDSFEYLLGIFAFLLPFSSITPGFKPFVGHECTGENKFLYS